MTISDIIDRAPEYKYYTTDGVSFPVNSSIIFRRAVTLESSGSNFFDGKLNTKVFNIEKHQNTIVFSIDNTMIGMMIAKDIKIGAGVAKLTGIVDQFGLGVSEVSIDLVPVRPICIFDWYRLVD